MRQIQNVEETDGGGIVKGEFGDTRQIRLN
jgi:hypothetical protein